MKDLQPFDIINVNNFNKRSDIFFGFLKKFMNFKKFNELYGEHSYKGGVEFVESIIDALNLNIEVIDEDLLKIPKEGPFVVVSNFPLGGIEALVLIKIISKIRNDFKIVSTNKYHQVAPLHDLTMPINDAEGKKIKPCLECTKNILTYLQQGGALGFFPAGKAATYNRDIRKVVDFQWDISFIKLIKKSGVPIIPVFFNDSFSKIFYFLGGFHPILQTFLIQKELFKKQNSSINVRIGTPIKPLEYSGFDDIWLLSRFLRARTYALGASSNLDVNKFFKYKKSFRIDKAEEIAPAVDPQVITDQINKAKEDFLLYTQSGFDIICAPSRIIPDVLTELGRLREITFRTIGEGTNKSLDIDEYDLYYNHLIIWDSEKNKIVGAYRIGRGDEIIERFSVDGFYLSSLFKMKDGLIPLLKQSLEMGRSFVVQEYQRKPLSLFMLWKGILYFLLKNPQYRYLIGPVSISQKFSELTKNLIVNYFEAYHYDPKLAKHVKPRKKYEVDVHDVDKHILLDDISDDINKLDKYIQEIEPGSRIPVLFKKYMGLGAKTIAFNVDPKFNNCLDGLMVLDIFNVPPETLKVLAKDLADEQVLERFNIES